jgi:hypothetical protein
MNRLIYPVKYKARLSASSRKVFTTFLALSVGKSLSLNPITDTLVLGVNVTKSQYLDFLLVGSLLPLMVRCTFVNKLRFASLE